MGEKCAQHAPKLVEDGANSRQCGAKPTTNALVGQIRLRFNDWSLRLPATDERLEYCRFAQFDVTGEVAAVEVIANFCRAFPDAVGVTPVTTRTERGSDTTD
jgi:hypothetical protein